MKINFIVETGEQAL